VYARATQKKSDTFGFLYF